MGRRILRICIVLVAIVLVLALVLTSASAAYDLATTGPTATVPPLDAHGHEARTADVVTRYEAWGRRGPALVLIPGFIESSFVWKRVGSLLGQHFRVYAVDVRGFGYTTHQAPYTLAADTRQMVGFLRALHLDAAHGALPVVIGHSSGAAIAANLALLHPSMVRGLIMLDGDGTASGAGPGWVHALIVDPFFTAALRLALTHSAVPRGIWTRVCGPRCPPMTGAELRAWTRPLEVPGAAAALEAIVQSPLIGIPASKLAQIRVPAAVMLGTGDPTITLGRARQSAVWLHTRTVVTVPGARHLPMVSNPRLFVHDVTHIVRRLRAASSEYRRA